MKRNTSFLLGIAVLVLILSIALQFRRSTVVEAHPRQIPLRELLPTVVPGWDVSDQPVADTEEMKRAVTEMLNYQEAVFRTYRREGDHLSVYVAYWRPGSVHPRLVTQHTPDVCWPGVGWNMVQSTGTAAFALPRGGMTWPGQARIFTAPLVTEHVVYWHLLGGRPSGYAQGPDSRPATYYVTLWEDIRYGQREQYFIRLSSNLTPAELGKSALTQSILAALASLGLEAR